MVLVFKASDPSGFSLFSSNLVYHYQIVVNSFSAPAKFFSSGGSPRLPCIQEIVSNYSGSASEFGLGNIFGSSLFSVGKEGRQGKIWNS
jgi:hypothetical protein